MLLQSGVDAVLLYLHIYACEDRLIAPSLLLSEILERVFPGPWLDSGMLQPGPSSWMMCLFTGESDPEGSYLSGIFGQGRYEGLVEG